jgi:hypothetical protein
MKDLYTYIDEGVLDMGNKKNISKYNHIKSAVDDFFSNTEIVGSYEIDDNGVVKIKSVIISDENFDGFPDYITFDNGWNFNTQLIIKQSKKLKTISNLPHLQRLVIMNCDNFAGFEKGDYYVEQLLIVECPKVTTLKNIPAVNFLELEGLSDLKTLEGISEVYMAFAARETGLLNLDGLETTQVRTVLLAKNPQLADIGMVPTSCKRLVIQNTYKNKVRFTPELVKEQCAGLLFDSVDVEIDGRKVRYLKNGKIKY